MIPSLSPTPLSVVGLAAGVVLVVLTVVHLLRRMARIQRDLARYGAEDERLSAHLQSLLGAQKAQVMANQATGQEKIPHLRRARQLMREAIQTGKPGDEEAFERLNGTIDLIEEELRGLGADPDEEPAEE